VATQLSIGSAGGIFVCFDPKSSPVKQMMHILNDVSVVAIIHDGDLLIYHA